MELTNSYTVILNSDTMGTATVAPIDAVTNTVTLDTATAEWPSASVDYYLHFEHDSYVEAYLVTARNSATVLNVVDVNGTLPTGAKKWLLRGYKKSEVLELNSWAVISGAVSQSEKTFQSRTVDGGENA